MEEDSLVVNFAVYRCEECTCLFQIIGSQGEDKEATFCPACGLAEIQEVTQQDALPILKQMIEGVKDVDSEYAPALVEIVKYMGNEIARFQAGEVAIDDAVRNIVRHLSTVLDGLTFE